jgi:uncharacterized membrane protein
VLFLFLLMIIALVVRAWGISRTNLWLDEANSWAVTRLPWSKMFANLRSSPVGPLYFLLLKPWVLLFGDSEAALRAPSLIAGILVIPVTYAIGVRLLSRRAAMLGALLVVLSPLHLYYSQEARMYMLLTLLAGICVLAYACWRDAITAPEGRSHLATAGLVLYTLASLALLFTNIVAAPLLVALNMDAGVLLTRVRARPGRGRAIVAWLAANGGIAAVYLFYLNVVSLNVAATTQMWRPPLGVLGALRALIQYPLTAVHGIYYYPHDFTRFVRDFLHSPNLGIIWGQWERLIVEPFALLAIVASLRHVPGRAWRGRERLLLLAVVIPLGAAAIISISRQLDLGRYVLFASPFLFLLMGEAFTQMGPLPRWLSLAVLLFAAGLGIRRYEAVTSRDSDYRPVAEHLVREGDAGGDVVLVRPDAPAQMLLYYLRDIRMSSIRYLPGNGPIARWLTSAADERAWLVLDYRSSLFAVSPDSMQTALHARVQRDFYEGGVRMVLAGRTASGGRGGGAMQPGSSRNRGHRDERIDASGALDPRLSRRGAAGVLRSVARDGGAERHVVTPEENVHPSAIAVARAWERLLR